jgi:PAS domain S-box-containing protein
MTPPSTAAILDRVDDPVAVVQDGTVAFANPAFSELTGHNDPTDADIGALAPQEHAPDVERFATAVQRGETTDESATLVLDGPDGGRQTVSLDAFRVEHDGAPAAALVFEPDADHERYQRIVEALPVGVFQATPGPEGSFRLVNEELVDMAGADSKADLLDRSVRSLYADPEVRESFSDRLENEGAIHDEELAFETLDGDHIWGAVTAVAEEVDGDTVFDGVVRDISDRKDLEDKLRQRAQRFRRMFRRHSAPMLLVDPETGHIQNANAAAASFYGYSIAELTGMSVDDLNELSEAEIARERERAEREDRNHFVFEHRLASGEVRTVEVHSSPVELDSEDLLFSIVFDVTDRKRYENRLETQRDNLDVLNQVLRHDIRNDLQLVLAYADMLSDEVDDEHAEYVQRIGDSADHAVELTKTARDISAVMLRDQTDHHAVALRSALESELDDVRTSFPGAAITVDGAIPPVTVRGNDMLGSVFRNLLKNAVQHNDEPVPEITVSATAGDDTVEVRVADNGPGVPDNQKDDIFGKGEKGLESSGTGMGLYLVQTLVESAGGSVRVEDNDPEGAVFVVELSRED